MVESKVENGIRRVKLFNKGLFEPSSTRTYFPSGERVTTRMRKGKPIIVNSSYDDSAYNKPIACLTN